jgi:Spy/CpxP family protein refolding chaperone
MNHHRIARRLAAVAAAGLIGASAAALAQPMHDHHRGGGDFGLHIAALKGQLNLNTSQQQMWDNAVAAGKSARQAARTNGQRLHDALAAELAKPAPDLTSVAAVADEVQAGNATLRHQVRDAWLALYATFTPEQKTVVRDALAKRMARMEQWRQKHQRPAHG